MPELATPPVGKQGQYKFTQSRVRLEIEARICNTSVPTKVDLSQANQLADVWSLVFGKSGADLFLSIEDQAGKVAIWWHRVYQ